jgi:ribosomal protein L37AE/L43A
VKSPRPQSGNNDKTKEVTMTTVASFRDSKSETTCASCGESLIAPEWSEYVSERLVINLWSCPNCGSKFETETCMPADAESAEVSVALETYFPSLLVA